MASSFLFCFFVTLTVYLLCHFEKSVRSPQISDRAERANDRGSGKEPEMIWITDAVMTTQEKIALNMAKFIQGLSLSLLEKLDIEADMWGKLHEDAEMLCRTISMRLNVMQDAG